MVIEPEKTTLIGVTETKVFGQRRIWAARTISNYKSLEQFDNKKRCTAGLLISKEQIVEGRNEKVPSQFYL